VFCLGFGKREEGKTMITLRRNSERRHVQHGKNDIWFTFQPDDHSEVPADDFGAIVAFDEFLFPPGKVATSRLTGETETVTYVYRGALAQEDSTGRSDVVHAGEFQHMIPGSGVQHREANSSETGKTHFFRLSLRPAEAGLEGAQQKQRFAAAQRRNTVCVVASPDGRKGSLPIHQDALVHSSVLDPGHHLIHELQTGRSVWLHIIHGEASMRDVVLTQGDGVGVTDEPSVSLTAQEPTEVLLIDMGPAPKPTECGVAR
jgi:quercetin 2,3-dioxygenase